MAAERAGYIALRRGQGMRKWLSLMLMISCALFSLTGCGSAAPERTTVEVKKNGHVTHTIVEDFTESYYDLEGLKDTIEEACEAYNGAMGSELVTLEEAEVEDGVLTAVMDYRSASAYAGFNRQALFTGTVAPLLAMYDGFFGPGTGSFFMAGLIGLCGLGLLPAMGLTKVGNGASNLGSLMIFALSGSILWGLGLAMAVAAFLGAQLGVRAAVKVGAKLVRPLIVFMCVALAIKLLMAA